MFILFSCWFDKNALAKTISGGYSACLFLLSYSEFLPNVSLMLLMAMFLIKKNVHTITFLSSAHAPPFLDVSAGSEPASLPAKNAYGVRKYVTLFVPLNAPDSSFLHCPYLLFAVTVFPCSLFEDPLYSMLSGFHFCNGVR